MMDINDVKELIDNVAQKPFLCSNTEITTDNGYVITTKKHYEKLQNTVCAKREEEKLYFTDGQNLQQLLNRRRW